MLRKRGFTLFEITVVIAVIIVLVGFISFLAQKLILPGKAVRIAGDIKSIERAILMYYSDTGFFPSPETLNDNGFYRLITNPIYLNPSFEVKGWDGPYLDTEVGVGLGGITFAVRCADEFVMGCTFTNQADRFEQVIYVFHLTNPRLIRLIDKRLDDGQLDRGEVRWDGSRGILLIGTTKK